MQIPITRFTLGNGLRVILSQDNSNPVVAINLWYNVGSRNERPGRTGFAHLFEHMMFQGSEHIPDTGHIAHVERAGGAMNGSTWFDRTNYYETLPANQLELGLWLESDRMGFFLPALTQEKLDNQRDVVKNERRWRVDNQPYGDWDERLQEMLYPPSHPYHHSVIGSMDDLDAATLDDVRDFFSSFYTPNNAVLTLCGDFEVARAKELIERYFGPIPSGPPVPPLPGEPNIPETLGGEKRLEQASEAALARVFLAFRIPPYGDPRFYAADLAAHLLGSGRASRLYRRLVREQQLATDVAVFTFPLVTGAAMFVVRATVRPESTAGAVERSLGRELLRMSEEDASSVELGRARTSIETQHLVSLQQVGQRADQLSMFATLFDAPELINTELDRYREVEPADIRSFAQKFLQPDNRAALVYEPAVVAVAA